MPLLPLRLRTRALLPALALALLASAPLAAQRTAPRPPAGRQQPSVPTIRATTTLVDVPVLVLSKSGEPMETLGRDDFTVYDNGRPQRISGFDNQPRPLTLAIIIDTSDYDAIDQAKRSALVITGMVVGAVGEAAIFTPGPEPREILPFTRDADKIAHALRHLSKSPTAPLGHGGIIEPLNLAMLSLRKQPRDHTRAALIISRSAASGGAGAEALMETGMSDAIPIFRLAPNRPKHAPNHLNPLSPQQAGTGQGSQRVIHPASPVGAHGSPTNSASTASIDLGGIVDAASGLAGKLVAPHRMDFVYASGGLTYSAGNDNDFDQKLSLVGDDLRAFYHLFYSPNDLTPQAAVHVIDVKVSLPATSNLGATSYRRTYLGIAPR